jgi:vacuolar-type H+-ATPase subunit F/Vma7
MSRLLVVTRPNLKHGFHLAGIDAVGVDDVETAQELISHWMEEEEVNLLAIDDGLLELMDPVFLKRLDSCENLPYLSIPGGGSLGPEATRRYRIAEMIRHAIGIHITFKGEEAEREE